MDDTEKEGVGSGWEGVLRQNHDTKHFPDFFFILTDLRTFLWEVLPPFPCEETVPAGAARRAEVSESGKGDAGSACWRSRRAANTTRRD